MAISVGNIANSGALASVSSSTFSLDNNKEDVVVLVALRDAETASTVTGVTYGGVALTLDEDHLQEDDDTNSDERTYIFRLFGAASGANDVVVTFSGTIDFGAVFAVAVSGLNDTGQPDATLAFGDNYSAPYEAGDATALNNQITTVAADTIIFDVVYSKDYQDFGVGTGRTQIGQIGTNGGGDRAFASYVIKSSAGAYTIDWDSSAGELGADDYSQTIVAYKATAAGSASTSPSSSLSPSESPSTSPSSSKSPSLSPSASLSPSSSLSPSTSPSISPSLSPSEPATIAVHKHYYYKVYQRNGAGYTYISTWSDEVFSDPRFKMNINNGASDLTIKLARSFDEFGEDVDVRLGNKVDVYVVDKEQLNGQLIYSGYISGYKPVIRAVEEYIEIVLFSFNAQFQRMILRDVSGNTTVTYNSYDPANILKDVINRYRALGGTINYTATSIDLTNTEVSYTFNTNTIKECVDKIIELCPIGWYFRIDPDNTIYLKPKHDTPDHTFIVSKHIENLETFRRIEDIVNRVLFTGGGDPNLFRKYENTASQEAYGLFEIKIVDERVTNTSTAQTMANREINTKKDPEVRSILTIVDSNTLGLFGYDIESVKVGETMNIKGLKVDTTQTKWDISEWDTDVWDSSLSASSVAVVQILSVDYTPDSLVIEASSRIPQIAKRIEDINRNLENSQTFDNPVAPV